MKNRLQFNRIPTLFTSGTTLSGGTTVYKSGRERANEALKSYYSRRDFIPLIGEPIVVRYYDDNDKKQLMLAIGKATGATSADTYGVEYHVIDTALLGERISAATDSAVTALDLASAATKDVANYLVILKNMILSGIGLSDGSYFDNDDPSGCGLYQTIPGTSFISAATSMSMADALLDEGLAETVAWLFDLSGATGSLSATTKEYIETIIRAAGLNSDEYGSYTSHDSTNYITNATSLDNADVLLDQALSNLSGNTISALGETNGLLGQLSSATIQLSADTDAKINELSGVTKSLTDNIIAAAGLNVGEQGAYPGHDETHHIKDATSLDNADVLLDAALSNLSAETIAEFADLTDKLQELSGKTGEIDEKVDELSANTVAKFEEVNERVNDLSASTMAIKAKEENIISAAGLEPDGTYEHQHNANYIDDAYSLFEADVILDSTVAALSANTMAADSALSSRIEELEGKDVYGVDAIDSEVDENGDTAISLTLYANEKVLSQSNQGLKTTIKLAYVPADKKIYLRGIDDVEISHIDVDDFVKDGMLESANVIVATEQDHAQHPELVVGETYLKLVFNTDAGRQEVFVSVKSLVDVYSVSATSLDYLTIEGYQIRANVDIEDGLASYDSVEYISGVTNNVIKAAGLNLGEQGTYPGHDETHYIKNATSLDNADVLLDQALWNLSEDTTNALDNVRASIDSLSSTTKELSATTKNYFETIINAAGLNTGDPGTYPGHDETHYIKDATSLDNADTLLDTAIWTLSGSVIGFNERLTDIDEKVDALSANTVAGFSAITNQFNEKIESAVTYVSGVVYNYVENRVSGLVNEVVYILSGDVTEYVNQVFSAFSGNVITYVDNSIEGLSGDVITYIDNSIENLSGDVITYIDESINGLSGDVIECIDQSVENLSGSILNYIYDNEEVTAAALNDLNERLDGVNGGNIYITNYHTASGSGEEELTLDGDDTVNAALGKLQKQILDNEEAVAGGLNALYEAILQVGSAGSESVYELSAATIALSGVVASLSAGTDGVLTLSYKGVEYGKYSPSADTTIDLELVGSDILLTGYEISTAETEEELAIAPTDNVNEAFGKVQKQIYDNELVVSAALNTLNDRIESVASGTDRDLTVLSASVATNKNNITVLSGLTESALLIDANDKVLTRSNDGLKANVSLVYSYNPELSAKTISFIGKNNEVISEINASEFIKDGMLEEVNVIEISGETYLSFVFNVDSGHETINVKVSDFVKAYTEGSGITIDSNDVVSVKLANKGDASYLKLDADGLYLSGLSSMNVAGAEEAGKLDHSVTFNITGEAYGSASTDFSGNQVGISTYKKFVTANSLSNLSLEEFLTIAKVAGDATLSFSTTALPVLPAGAVKETHFIIENTGSTDIAITIANDARVKSTTGNTIFIEANGIGELNALVTYNGSGYVIYVITT